MRWIGKMKTNGKPTMYEGWIGDQETFCISTFAGAIYLQDLREREECHKQQKGLTSYSFDTIDNAKLAAKNSLKGIAIVSNREDPFGKLSDIIQRTEELLKKIKEETKNETI